MKFEWTIKNILAVIAAVGVFAIIIALMFIELPNGNKDIFSTTIGAVIGGTVVAVYAYFFGDSDKVVPQDKSEEIK